jgi:hypothetical protein
MALSQQEFEELKSLIGVGAENPTETPAPAQRSAGGGRGSYLTGVTNPLQYIAAQRAYESQKQLEQQKAALEKEGYLRYTGRKALETLTGQGEGNIASNAITGGLRQVGAFFGSEPAQKELDIAEAKNQREKQLQDEIAMMEGRSTDFLPKVAETVANVGRYAVQEPKLFSSQMISGLADPVALSLGGIGAPIKGASLLSNVARTAGGGALAGGVTSAARTFGQGSLDLQQAAEEAATSGLISGALPIAGKAISLPYKAVTAPFKIAGDILMPAKEPIPKTLSDLVAKDPEIAQRFQDAAELKSFLGKDYNPNLSEITKELSITQLAKEASANSVEAINTIRTNRLTSENALQSKIDELFPSSNSVLQSFGSENAQKLKTLQGLSAYADNTIKNLSEKFLSSSGKYQDTLGENIRQAIDTQKKAKKGYYDTAFGYLNKEADLNNIGLNQRGVENVYTATQAIDDNLFQTLPPVLQKAIEGFRANTEQKTGSSFSLIDQYSKELNKEVGIRYRAATAGDPNARIGLGQLETAKNVLDNEIKSIGGDFGNRYIQLKQEYGKEFMNPFYEGIGGQLSRRNRFGDTIKNEDVFKKFNSPEVVNQYIKINGRTADSINALTDAMTHIFLSKDSAVKSDGTINSNAVNSFIRGNPDVFRIVPEIKNKFENLSINLEAYGKTRANAEKSVADMADAASNTLIRKTRLEDVFNTNESGAFAKPEMLNKLLNVSKKDTTGTETKGVQRAMLDTAFKQDDALGFIVKNKSSFDNAFGKTDLENAQKLIKAMDMLGNKIDIELSKKARGFGGVATDIGITAATSFVSPIFSATYATLSLAARFLKNRKERIDNASYMNAFTNPETVKDLLTSVNKARTALASGKQDAIDKATGTLRQTMIANGVIASEDTQNQQQLPQQAVPSPTMPESAPTQGGGLSDQEFQELKKLYGNEPQKERVSSIIEDEATKLGISDNIPLLIKLAKQESGYKQGAISPKGAIGVMQLMPTTAQELGVDPNDLEQNVRGGVRYWSQQLKRFGGDIKLATAAYNAGAGNVIKAGNKVPNFAETQKYVQAIVG